MTIVLWLLALGIVLLYGGAPVLVKRTFWASLEPGPRFVRPYQLEPEVVEALDRRGAELEALGFEHLADIITAGWLPDTTAYSRYLADGARTTVALASVVVGETEDRRESHEFTAFGCRRLNADSSWADITTTDSSEPSPVEGLDDVVVRIPDAPAATLLVSHRRSVEEHATGRVLGRVRSPVDVAREDLERTVRLGVEQGVFVPDPDEAGRYRFTWRGAYTTTWRNLPPWLGLERRRHRRAGRKRLREIGASPKG